MRKHGSVLATVIFVLVATHAAAQATGQPAAQETKKAKPEAVEYRGFQVAVGQYVALRSKVKAEVPTLTVTTRSKEISNASDVLAGSIQRARPQAKQGDFFDGSASRTVIQRLGEALQGQDIAQLLVRINDEPVPNQRPHVYMRFPVKSSMATMPTNLLDTLPQLPQELEFRFIGRYLVLRDRDAALILDYVTDALPPPSAPAKRP